jgi:15-cis-phytoene synthase
VTVDSDLYLRAAEAASGEVISRYSTSFGLASRLLGPFERRHVQNVYALVRVADEIVDGVAEAAGLAPADIATRLDDYQAELHRALETGYSTDLVIHAFATTAREVGFGAELVDPFFDSMRTDITRTEYDQQGFDAYVYGSAEVVGLMCLAAFLHGRRMSDAQRERFVLGARALGAAFQKVNFLRDLSADYDGRGRSYFPGVTVDAFDEVVKTRLLDDIDADLAVAQRAIDRLPRGSRRAVAVAHDLFAELSRRLRAVPADELVRRRVSVPDAVKALLAVRAIAGIRR